MKNNSVPEVSNSTKANRLITGDQVAVGDHLVALASSGPHSNGYSLIRHIIEQRQLDLSQKLDGKMMSDLLLEPTRIYVKAMLAALKRFEIKAISHITGGGITENLPRVLPQECSAQINTDSWQWPSIFTFLAQEGGVADHEMLRTFNCGVGLIVCVNPSVSEELIEFLNEFGETASPGLGRLSQGHLHCDNRQCLHTVPATSEIQSHQKDTRPLSMCCPLSQQTLQHQIPLTSMSEGPEILEYFPSRQIRDIEHVYM